MLAAIDWTGKKFPGGSLAAGFLLESFLVPCWTSAGCFVRGGAGSSGTDSFLDFRVGRTLGAHNLNTR